MEQNCHRRRCISGEGFHGHHGGCHRGGSGKGKRRHLFEERYSKYLLSNPIPSFENDVDFENWLKTESGQKYAKDIDALWLDIEQEHPWGGKRNCAGRKKTCAKKIPFNRRISADVLNILKLYSEKHQISETEALERAIMLLEES